MFYNTVDAEVIAKGAIKMILNETFTLSNGVKIPKLGFGTWMIDNDAVVQNE